MTSQSLITDQLNALGWSYEGDFGMSLVVVGDTDAALRSHIMFLLNSVSEGATSFSYRNGVVSIYNDYMLNEERIRMRLSSLARDFNNVVALTNPFTSFNQAGDAYREAMFLSEISERYPLNGQLVEFSGFFIEYLSLHADSTVMFKDKVSMLQKHDKAQGTEYCDTLYQWLLFERNTVKTAQHLFVHRNTLKNRLVNIEKLLGLDLEKVEIRLQLIIALHQICARPELSA